jgi:hypothetical protein
MGFRFQRRLRVLPGVRINLSKSGVSTSIGGRGAWLTIGRRRTRATLGLPGTGLSYTTTARPGPVPLAASAGEAAADDAAGSPRRGAVWFLLILVVLGYLAWQALA